MGNSAISRNISDISEKHHGTAGHLQLWQIRTGTSIKTNEQVSVWTFEKGDLSKTGRKGGAITDRAIQEQIYAVMLRDMKVMTETSGHSIVKVIEILQEDKSTLAFTTEPVLCSLADLMYQFDVVPDGARKHAAVFGSNSCLSEMEISRGLGQVVEGVQVLHTVHRRLHLSLSPESIMITPASQWKMCSLGYSLAFEAGDHSRVASPYFLKAASHKSVRIEPDLRYHGQEVTVGGIDPPSIRYLSPATDVFSVGLLFFELYRYNLKLIPDRRPHMCIVPLSNNSALDHPNALSQSVGTIDMNFLPHGLSSLLESMLSTQTHLRLSTSDISNHAYFSTGNLAVLRAVDALPSRDVGTQGSQLLSMRSQLDDFPPRLLVSSVLPTICQVTNQNAALWVYALPLHETIMEKLSDKLSYRSVVQDAFASGLGVINPVETMQAFLRSVNFMRDTFDSSFFETNVINKLIVNCFDKAHTPLQCQLFSVLCDKKVHSAVSAQCMLQTVVPKSCKEACKNPETTVKVHALYFLSNVLDRMDKPYLAKNVLPSLKYITEKDKAPQVTMTVIGIYEAMSENLGSEYISVSILPTIQPFLMDRTLDKEQFVICANLVRQLLKKVLDMRCKELGMNENELSEGATTLSGKFDYFAAARKLLESTTKNAARDAPKASTVNVGHSGLRLPPAPTSAPPPPPTSAPPSFLPEHSSAAPEHNPHAFKMAGDASQYRYDANVDMGRISGTQTAPRPSQAVPVTSYGASNGSSPYHAPQTMAPLKSPPVLTKPLGSNGSTSYSGSGSGAFGMDDMFGSLGASAAPGNVFSSGSSSCYNNNSNSSMGMDTNISTNMSSSSNGGSSSGFGFEMGSSGGGGGESLEEQIKRTQKEIAAAQANLTTKRPQPIPGYGGGGGGGGGREYTAPSQSNSNAYASQSNVTPLARNQNDPFGVSMGNTSQNGGEGAGGFAFMNQQPQAAMTNTYGMAQSNYGVGYGNMGSQQQQQNSAGGFAFMNQQPACNGNGNQYGMNGGQQQQQQNGMGMGMGMGMSQTKKTDPFDFLN